MRILEVRRHSMRRKPGEHLSQDGIELARLVGEASGPFGLVVTSTVPRAIETAIAMGFEVHETLPALGEAMEALHRKVGWPNPFPRVARAVKDLTEGAEFARGQSDLWRRVVERIEDGQRALIITHGGFVEFGAVASAPSADHSAWGVAIGYCEGVRLTFEDGFTSCEILRVPEEHRLIEN